MRLRILLVLNNVPKENLLPIWKPNLGWLRQNRLLKNQS